MALFPDSVKKVLVTGGAGFIGGAVIRRLLKNTSLQIYNLDKMGYASDLTSIDQVIKLMGIDGYGRHELIKVNLVDAKATGIAVAKADPDLVIHLAAESHVDRSISTPLQFIESNIIGTFNILQSLAKHWEKLPIDRRKRFRMIHISTDEVFGSLPPQGQFSECSPYDPRSPYSASKAASDHLVKSWFHTFGFPVITTNCSNNYGPWQFPEKLIPMVIMKAIKNKEIPIYGDGQNIRDWLFVEDHVDALLAVSAEGEIGRSYCIGGINEISNKKVVELICSILDEQRPKPSPYSRLIQFVPDRPGHDRRYSINPKRICKELAWKPKYEFNKGLQDTVHWYLNNLDWCESIMCKSNYKGERIGLQ